MSPSHRLCGAACQTLMGATIIFDVDESINYILSTTQLVTIIFFTFTSFSGKKTFIGFK